MQCEACPPHEGRLPCPESARQSRHSCPAGTCHLCRVTGLPSEGVSHVAAEQEGLYFHPDAAAGAGWQVLRASSRPNKVACPFPYTGTGFNFPVRKAEVLSHCSGGWGRSSAGETSRDPRRSRQTAVNKAQAPPEQLNLHPHQVGGRQPWAPGPALTWRLQPQPSG